MFESLKYIEKKFPSFLDMTSDSNNYKVVNLLDEIYTRDYDNLEKIRNGYYYNYNDTLREHISVNNNILTVVAEDISSITVTKDSTGEIIKVEFPYSDHRNSYETNIGSGEYLIIVQTWNEYTYTTITTGYNSDIDLISNTWSGATRRDYKW